VCLSDCLSVTRRCSTETAKRITQKTPHDSPATHTDAEDRDKKTQTGSPPDGGAKCRWGRLKLATFDRSKLKRALNRQTVFTSTTELSISYPKRQQYKQKKSIFVYPIVKIERTEINGESTSMVWPTLRSRKAKEQNRTEHSEKTLCCGRLSRRSLITVSPIVLSASISLKQLTVVYV